MIRQQFLKSLLYLVTLSCKYTWALTSDNVCKAPSNGDGTKEDGFGDNQARGTGHVFTAQALDGFLRHYGLSHLVRAHEVRKAGFQVQQHSRMVTIFSSSGYCGVRLHTPLLQLDTSLIQLDTSLTLIHYDTLRMRFDSL
jgi:hypothetical protein